MCFAGIPPPTVVEYKYITCDGKQQKSYNLHYGENLEDVHFWCEDENGVIHEPSPIKDQLGNFPRWYKKWDNQEEAMSLYWENSMKQNAGYNNISTELFKKQLVGEAREGIYEYKSRCCGTNSWVYSQLNPKCKIVVGSFGWKVNDIIALNWGV